MAGLYVFIFLVSMQIIFTVNAAPYFDGLPPEAEKMLKECNESFPIDMGYLKDLNDTGSFHDEDNKTPKCFIRCVLMKAGLMDEDFTFDAPKLKEAFKDSKYPDMDNMIDMCIAKDTETQCRCTKAYLFIKCLMSEEITKYGDASKVKTSN
uniref:Chemosensory protein n=1 Tax=Blattella germanica TaxID=6973 RepID=A0A0X8DBJ9_BLAGE|nr:chemosensory protein [Blattella germanica]